MRCVHVLFVLDLCCLLFVVCGMEFVVCCVLIVECISLFLVVVGVVC